jgi:hypothetical protein
MRALREIGTALRAAAATQARWEREVSAAVLGSRKRLLWLLLLALPVFLLAPSQAAQILPEKIPILGGSRAFMPSLVTETMFFGSILVGLIAGLITGVIGAGGGYILTPALMSFGVRGIMAVGTDQFHLFAKAIVGTAIHRKLGNVHLGLAAWFAMLAGSRPVDHQPGHLSVQPGAERRADQQRVRLRPGDPRGLRDRRFATVEPGRRRGRRRPGDTAVAGNTTHPVHLRHLDRDRRSGRRLSVPDHRLRSWW